MNEVQNAMEKAMGLKKSITTNGDKADEKRLVHVEPVAAKGMTMHPNNPRIIMNGNPDSPIAEEYRKLKSLILRMTKDEFRNTVMVTSSVSGEGKSLTSANLAIMMAREYGQTVLLVDSDLRRPSLHEYLGMAPHVGLADCLEDRIDAGRAIVKTGIQKLSFMSAGKKVENPGELLTSHRMRDFLLELKHRYRDRYIIIDTPPILMFAETQAMSLLVDGVLVVVKEGGASLKGITQMFEVLKGSTVLGVVYNDASTTSLGGKYYDHYKHYYHDDHHGKKKKKH
jgi:exopolysaccharide/PEP-CTERM locus tyrosine autokinase